MPNWASLPTGVTGGSGPSSGDYDEKIALLRSLLSRRDEVTDSADWLEQFKRASLDDTIYVLTPQGRVIDLPGATPIDFAYRGTPILVIAVGVPRWFQRPVGHLNTPLESGPTVEIMSTKEGALPRLAQRPAELRGHALPGVKIKQYFSALEEEELLVRGRSVLTREIQREGMVR